MNKFDTSIEHNLIDVSPLICLSTPLASKERCETDDDSATICAVVHRCTNGRSHATTEQYGFLTNTATQTVRKNFSQTGECFGIKPIKVGNKLLWPTTAIIRLLGGA